MYDFKSNENKGIAVIGIAGRFPGALNVEQYWENICNGVESISFFSDEELMESGIDKKLLKKENFIKARGILGNTDKFDARFFGLHAREAALMDPQHRLFLECAWNAFESAGYCPENHKGHVGVFAGSSMNTYMLNNLMHLIENIESVESLQIALGNDKDSLTTEVAYRLNLRGPAVTIQSSSSTSLTAIHYAAQSLLNYESDMALAGGVSIHFPEKSGYIYREGGTTSPDGHCRAFDAKADGFVAGHGAGVVLMKRMEDALEDGDTIWAVIKGSAANNDGAVKMSYMAPGVEGQSRVFAIAQVIAGVDPEDISYIEAHGTGTRIGDPIELASLTRVFSSNNGRKNYCAIGSVKPNIGHLDAAAGIAGFIKVILMLKNKKLPPQINFMTPNPQFNLEDSPFYINTELRDWEASYRIAGINSFGMGGTNTHIIISESPETGKQGISRSAVSLVLSARTKTALQKATHNLVDYLEKNQDLNIQDAAFTLQTGKSMFEYRNALVCHDLQDAILNLKTADPESILTGKQESVNQPLFFMFTDILSDIKPEISGICRDIPVYKKILDRCLNSIQSDLKENVKKYFYLTNTHDHNALLKELEETKLTGIILFILEYTLASVLLEWGIKPKGIIGLGAGEYAAACLSGTLKLEDALLLSSEMNWTDGYFQKSIPLTLNKPSIPFLSPVSGKWITNIEATNPDYWQQEHKTKTFHSHILEISGNSASIFLEVGPGTEMSGSLKQHQRMNPALKSSLIFSCLSPKGVYKTDYAAILEAVNRLWLAGVNIDFNKLYTNGKNQKINCRRIPLPTYPFEYNSHWVSPPKKEKRDNKAKLLLDDKKTVPENWFYIPAWEKNDSAYNPSRNAANAKNAVYLVFLPGQEQAEGKSLINNIMKILKTNKKQIITVTPGSHFNQSVESQYEIDPRRYEDYVKLIKDIKGKTIIPEKILYCWNLNVPGDYDTPAYLHQCLETGFNCLLFFVKALNQLSVTNTILITALSSYSLDTNGAENVFPEKTNLLAACRIIPQECSNIFCHFIDITIPAKGSIREQILAERLSQECASEEKSNYVIACRGEERMIQTVKNVQLNQETKNESWLKPGGVYWIIGGLGTVGYIIAKTIVKNIQANLIISGNTPIPGQMEWDAWLSTHPDTDPVSKKIKKLKSLQSPECDVMYAKADLLDINQLKVILEKIKTRFININGVIDAAGTVNTGIFKAIKDFTSTETMHNLKTKWYGLYNLSKIIKRESIGFCLLCSSLSSLLGGLGLAAYTAGNLFMDAFAARQNISGKTYWMSINWDAFAETSQIYKNFGTPLLDLAITASEAEEVILKILMHTFPRNQYLISTHNLQNRLKKWMYTDNRQTPYQEEKKDKIACSPRPNLQNNYIAPTTILEKELALIWAQILGLESVGITDNFFELGGNSLAGITLISEIRKKYNYEISPVDIYESPTIKSLIKMLQSRRGEIESGETLNVEKGRDRAQKRLEQRRRNLNK